MTTPSQRDIINEIKTDQALMKQDLKFVKKQQQEFRTEVSKQLDLMLKRIDSLAFVPLGQFEDFRHGFTEWQHSTERRLKTLEDYNSKNSLGIRFSNDVAGTIFKVITAAIATGILLLAGWYVGRQ